MKRIMTFIVFSMVIMLSFVGLVACTNNAPSNENSKMLTSIKLKQDTLSSVYEINNKVDLSNGKLILTWNDSTTSEISVAMEMFTNLDLSIIGERIATITYEDKTCTFNYTVYDYLGKRTTAKETIKNHINKYVNEEYYLSHKKITSVKNDYFTQIDLALTSFNDLATKATILIDLIILDDINYCLINYIDSLYNPDIITSTEIINSIIKIGYYEGSQDEHLLEKTSYENKITNAYSCYNKMIKELEDADTTGLGVSETTKIALRNQYLSNVPVYQNKIKELDALWERKLDFEEASKLKMFYKERRNEALELQKLDYTQQKKVLSDKLLQFGEIE